MLYMIYRKYCEGDAGFAAGNLIGLLFLCGVLVFTISAALVSFAGWRKGRNKKIAGEKSL